MTVKMEDTSKAPAVIVVDSAKESGEESRSSWKAHVTKKRLITAGSSVLIAIIIVVGILIGVKFFLNSQNDILKRTFEFASADSDKTAKQDVMTDSTDNLIQYHLKDANKEIFVIEDYNRDIKILKVVTPSGDKCFVSPLNGTDRAVEYMKNATSPAGTLQTLNSYYEIAQTAIKETSILGTTGQLLCAANNAYWMVPSCRETVNNKTSVSRKKRGICYYYSYECYYCYYYPYWYNCCAWYINYYYC